MRIAAVQHDIAWCDVEANLARLGPMVERAAGQGADLVLLSETFPTGFATDRRDIGVAADGPVTDFLAEHAARLGTWVCGTYAELPAEGGDRPYNTFVLSGPDGTVHRYRKIHTFGFGGETDTFDAGTELVTAEIGGLRMSPLICYDLRFADEFWSLAPVTDVYLVPANWPSPRREHWRTLLRARAIENQAYVVGCNRVGDGGGLHYSGDSAIIDPLGTVLVEAAETETVLVADIDAATVAEVRERLPFLADRR